MSWHDYRGVMKDRIYRNFDSVNSKGIINPYEKPINSFYTQQCQENEIKLICKLDPNKYYHTVRVSNSGDKTHNAVLGSHLCYHIAYNQTMRFGQALFVDGCCVFTGYLSEERCNNFSSEWFKTKQQMPKYKLPYE